MRKVKVVKKRKIQRQSAFVLEDDKVKELWDDVENGNELNQIRPEEMKVVE